MKNSFYFDHDYNARNDHKILEVRAEYGWEGYAIFFALLESLCESNGYIKREALAGLSLGLNVPKDKLNEYLSFYIKIGLFMEDGIGIYSQRILDHLMYRHKLSIAGSMGGRGNKKPPFSLPLAPLEAGEERKEYNIYTYSAFYDSEIKKVDGIIDSEYPHFVKWLFENNINKRPLNKVLKLKDQITVEMFEKYRRSYPIDHIKDTILNLENYTKKTYSSFNTTLNNWLKPKSK